MLIDFYIDSVNILNKHVEADSLDVYTPDRFTLVAE